MSMRSFPVLRLLTLAMLAATPELAPAAAAPHVSRPTSTFEQAFAHQGEPASVHYLATFLQAGREHHMEAWRDADRRLLRRTDDALEVYATHSGSGPDFEMIVVDLKRHIRSSIDRDSLQQVGHFLDWQDMADAIKHPLGAYRVKTLARAPAGAALPAPAAPCRWAEIDEAGKVSRICWSASLQLPMLIVDGANRPSWRITQVQRQAIPASRFVPPKAGFVLNDADQDIQHD